MRRRGIYRNFFKRVLDMILSFFALVILSPVLLVTAILVRVKLGSPVVFRQPRPGLHEKIFYLYKFRSMTNETGEDGRLLPDAQRLTGFGKFLRASSLDELLELFNILRGDMSIVGPRPLSIYYLPHYPAKYRSRHDVRPGLTGLAQVNGRNNLPWDERFAMDVRYVESVSFAADLRIILDTALKVVRREGVSVRGTARVKDYGPYRILQEEGDGGKRMAGMTYSEIGSYFWLDGSEKRMTEAAGSAEDGHSKLSNAVADAHSRRSDAVDGFSWLPEADDGCLTFSGRNAIDTVLRDILREHDIRCVYAPSYCCVSMIQSFLDRGMDVRFYPVNMEGGQFCWQLPEAGPGSVVLIMSYFGLRADAVHSAIHELRQKGAVVIEDVTHSLLSGQSACPESDYLAASLRKWFAVPAGGWAGKRGGTFSEKPSMDSEHAVRDKIAGMEEKYAYLTGRVDTKEDFLLAQAKFDNDLIHVDRMLRIDSLSLWILRAADIGDIVRRRRENAAVLLRGLKELGDPRIGLPAMDPEKDTPLFVPVFLETADRDALRQHLISRGIYCPVHWPEVMGAPAGVREKELSLICDQRYGAGDMQAIVDAIREWAQGETRDSFVNKSVNFGRTGF